MAFYRITFRKCPGCGFAFDSSLFGLSSSLGPAAGSCPRCAKVVATGRREWSDLAFADRLSFGAVSTFYAVVFGWICGWFARNIVAMHAGERAPTDTFSASDPTFRIVAVVAALLVVMTQVWRVLRSNHRAAELPRVVRALPYFYEASLDFGLQMKFLLVPVLVYFVADVLER